MPNMADITIKKADGTTNVTYVKKAPASGDRTAAVWTADAESAVHGHRPEARMTTRSNGSTAKPGRIANFSTKFHVVATINGVPTILATVPFRTECTLPTNVDSAQVAEGIAQHGNLLVSALVRQALNEGFAPT